MEQLHRCVIVVALAAVLTRPISAQSKVAPPNRADLLGTWVLAEDTAAYKGNGGHQFADFLILNADSTWKTIREMDGERHPKISTRLSWVIDLEAKQDGKGGWVGRTLTEEGWEGRWTLVGDTLRIPGGLVMLVAVQGEHLFLDVRGHTNLGDFCNVFTRYTPGKAAAGPCSARREGRVHQSGKVE